MRTFMRTLVTVHVTSWTWGRGHPCTRHRAASGLEVCALQMQYTYMHYTYGGPTRLPEHALVHSHLSESVFWVVVPAAGTAD